MPRVNEGRLEEVPGDREKIARAKASPEKTKQAVGIMMETALETGLPIEKLIETCGLRQSELELLDARKAPPGEAFFTGYLLGLFEAGQEFSAPPMEESVEFDTPDIVEDEPK